ncbi:hypothetical protein [Phaeobacter gallaeciensis]|uniref:hypothetical protein n=1 Tax=Phaeobacter gallaeciensis TaxID=60890 RepID=UPI00237F6935|nr:hypothetical protein [Phaeobacter gallaeciensis]MDE4059774.1 hypothetical protein [Phaeobacter gallaeciensis]MDE4122589.1 hypothetical protein [Phaeobacter gallaeciensis]MDE4127262.1 hypothetical protein [Phaeobacter gallaeciensis]
MSDLERLNIILAARDREFARAMERNQRRVERFAQRSQKNLSRTSKSFDAMGFAAKRLAPVMAALGAGAVIARVRRTVSTLDDIGKTADKMGLTTDALQELRTVAESAGIAQASLDSSMERFNKRLGEAQLGTGAAAKMLKTLGLEADALATAGLDDALGQVADKIAEIADPTERAAAAAALFGREGVAMVNLLREGSAGMGKMRQEARDLGIVIDESLIRGAEDAQTKLDLMGRVISAQLNSALIDLAPLLVGGATAVADLARGFNAGLDAVQSFLDPQGNLQRAVDNVVLAMGDEIRQSQLLDQALGRGVSWSQAAAQAKLEEARTRHENAKAAIAETRAIALQSDEYNQLRQGLEQTLSSPYHAQTGHPFGAVESEQAVALVNAMSELLAVDATLQQHLDRTAENIEKLEAAIGGSKGGIVSVEGDGLTPIDPSERATISDSGASAKAAIPDLNDYAEVMRRIKGIFGDVAVAGDGYTDTLAKLEALKRQGILTEAEYADALGAVESKFQGAKSAADSLRSATASTFASIVTGAESASDAVSNLLSNLAGQFANAAFGGLFKSVGVFDALGGLLSFDGGGHTGAGARSGGLDGKGGFLAMVHPNESVIDHTKGQRMSAPAGAPGVNITIQVSGARGNSEITEMVQTGVRQGLQEYDRSVLPRSVQKINSDPRRIG